MQYTGKDGKTIELLAFRLEMIRKKLNSIHRQEMINEIKKKWF